MKERTGKSRAAFKRARKVLVGGVNSPVRAFLAVGGDPVFIASAAGSHVTDIDGNTYVDYVGGYGPAILGHADERVTLAVNRAVSNGLCYGAPTEAETRLAAAVVQAVESIEKVRFVNSGTEATMSAVRLARGATGRTKIIKCVGCYHGHADHLLVSAGSGATTLGVPSSPGVTSGATGDTILVPYNDAPAMRTAFENCPGDIAAVLIEPIAGNMGVVPPADGYLQSLRRLCDEFGALLIFDEVMTGFRVSYGGAQELYGVRPDITTLGKIVGAGMPVGAIGGPARIMDHFSPEGPVYQAGTLSGNPAAMAAGLAALEALQEDGFYERLEERSASLEAGFRQAAADAGLDGKVAFNRVGSMLCCFFAQPPVTNYATATGGDLRAFAAYFREMLAGGVFMAPSQFEAMFVSAAHDEDDVARTTASASKAFTAAAKIIT